MTRPAYWFAAVAILLGLALSVQPAAPIRVMILDGQSGGPYHAWRQVSAVLQKELEEAGLFQVDIVTAPESGGDFSNFKPDFTRYGVVVFNYDAPDWPGSLKSSFEQYVRNGGGMVAVHAADNAFPSWR